VRARRQAEIQPLGFETFSDFDSMADLLRIPRMPHTYIVLSWTESNNRKSSVCVGACGADLPTFDRIKNGYMSAKPEKRDRKVLSFAD
jgi:hypothetical protein